MREQFEKLPEIKERLDMKCVHFNGKWYATNPHMGNSFATASYLNGAYYAYQEQQKKISVKDELKELHRKEVDFLRNQTSKAILALYSENKEGALSILKESIKE